MARSSDGNGEVVYTLRELCSACRVEHDYVLKLVSHGIIEPRDDRQREWHFTAAEVSRTSRAYRLHEDLELNFEGVALALELMDRNRRLKERVRFLEQLMDRLQQ